MFRIQILLKKQNKKDEEEGEEEEEENHDVTISNSLLVNSVNIFIGCDSYFFFLLLLLSSRKFFFFVFIFLLRHGVYPRLCRRSMKIMMMMMIWETATSVCVKRKTTMKLSSLSQSYFHPTVYVICILGTANTKRKKFNECTLALVLASAFFSSIYSI